MAVFFYKGRQLAFLNTPIDLRKRTEQHKSIIELILFDMFPDCFS